MSPLIHIAYLEFFLEKNFCRMSFVPCPDGTWSNSIGNTYKEGRLSAQEFFDKVVDGSIIEINKKRGLFKSAKNK